MGSLSEYVFFYALFPPPTIGEAFIQLSYCASSVLPARTRRSAPFTVDNRAAQPANDRYPFCELVKKYCPIGFLHASHAVVAVLQGVGGTRLEVVC